MTALATFAAGCFWGIEERFRTQPGVINTRVGYIGGHVAAPTYQQVCHHDTGHAEAVEVSFDESIISYQQLLDTFWQCHNPTLINRQGYDVGSQYRSAIFTHSDEQQQYATASKAKLDAARQYSQPIATEIIPAPEFYPAEEYHQQYILKKGSGSCKI